MPQSYLRNRSGASLALPGPRITRALLREHGIQEDSPVGRQEFEGHMEARRREEEDEQGLKPLRRGWCLGSEEFRQKMLELMERKLGVGRTKPPSDALP